MLVCRHFIIHFEGRVLPLLQQQEINPVNQHHKQLRRSRPPEALLILTSLTSFLMKTYLQRMNESTSIAGRTCDFGWWSSCLVLPSMKARGFTKKNRMNTKKKKLSRLSFKSNWLNGGGADRQKERLQLLLPFCSVSLGFFYSHPGLHWKWFVHHFDRWYPLKEVCSKRRLTFDGIDSNQMNNGRKWWN